MDLNNIQIDEFSIDVMAKYIESEMPKLDIQNLFLKFKVDQSIQTTSEFEDWIYNSFKQLNQTLDD